MDILFLGILIAIGIFLLNDALAKSLGIADGTVDGLKVWSWRWAPSGTHICTVPQWVAIHRS
jgi:hypothetical protein